MFAARLWFLCRWIGHDACAVLDGGYTAWIAGGYPVTTRAYRSRAPDTIAARARPELVVDAAYVLAHLDDPRMQLLDARAADRFAGQNETVDPVAGHIPGARNRFFKENFRRRRALQVAARTARGVPSRSVKVESIVHQCGSGISGALNHARDGDRRPARRATLRRIVERVDRRPVASDYDGSEPETARD